MTPLAYYTDLTDSRLASAIRLEKRYDRLSLLRLLAFLIIVTGLVFAFSYGFAVGLVVTILLIIPVRKTLRFHRHLGKRGARARVQYELAKAEIRGLHYDFSGWADGTEFADPDHPYSTDLDIFGRHSLYQFLNRTISRVGARRLAVQLTVPATHEDSAARRAAGIALASTPDWCMHFRTLGAELDDSEGQIQQLLAWVSRPPVITGSFARVMMWATTPLAALGCWFCFTREPWQLGLLAFVPALLLMRRFGDKIAAEHAYTSQAGEMLRRYRELLRHIETHYRPGDHLASDGIGNLGYLVTQLDVRNNPFVFLLEITGAWSLHWSYRLDRWRATCGAQLAGWLDELAEVDARVSWSTLRFNRPGWTEPLLTEERVLNATGLGHPLLPPSVRITNDLDLSTDGHIHLVTGSNMAGKSTWLRTVGLNIVLARAGGPVCASHLRTAALNVWTSMRTQDDLGESTSSFYAELKRLKVIIEAVGDPQQQVFFLLDEILKGTNSRDRHTGSRALIRQLIRERGAGIIATHDLELADLEMEKRSRVENYAMEVQTKGDDLVFDYKLQRGVSRSFNATALMARMGIEIDPADISLTHD